jgi:hypothetical protein
VPYALCVFLVGLVLAFLSGSTEDVASQPILSLPSLHLTIPTPSQFRTGALVAGVGQLPLTTLNSIIAVCALARDLNSPPLLKNDSQFIAGPTLPTETSLGLSVAMMNLIGCWFGAMPTCHGSGGLAAQWRFGARSGTSVIMLGMAKVALSLLFEESRVVNVLRAFPEGLLGVMVAAAGVHLAGVVEALSEVGIAGQYHDTSGTTEVDAVSHSKLKAERTQAFTVMLVTVAGLLAFRNDAVGFVAGLACHGAYKLPTWLQQSRTGAGVASDSVGRVRGSEHEGDRRSENQESQRLLDV